jgi:hypothetical protein
MHIVLRGLPLNMSTLTCPVLLKLCIKIYDISCLRFVVDWRPRHPTVCGVLVCVAQTGLPCVKPHCQRLALSHACYRVTEPVPCNVGCCLQTWMADAFNTDPNGRPPTLDTVGCWFRVQQQLLKQASKHLCSTQFSPTGHVLQRRDHELVIHTQFPPSED